MAEPPTQEGEARTVLVAYASGGGSARGVAEAVGRTLGAAGFVAEVRDADEVTGVDRYNAVVLGSDLKNGFGGAGWLPEATELLESFQETLAQKPLWLFADVQAAPGTGLSAGPLSAAFVTLIEATEPLGIGTFCGGVPAKGFGAAGNAGDSGDAAVATWALTIAAHLGAGPVRPGADALPGPKGV